MKKFEKFTAIAFMGIATLLSSCEKDESTQTNETKSPESSEVSQDILDKLEKLAFNTNNVTVEDIMLPDGTTEKRYLVEGDITLSEDYINTMELNGGVQSEQYRTRNLVRPGRYTVVGFTGGRFALSERGRTGLQWAVNNYNRLNLNISLDLSFGTDIDDADMVIYDNPDQRGSGGSAGFPVGGRPHRLIQIYGLDRSSNNVNEHVITHEIGHALGFRHTDYFSRQSCGQRTNEGSGGVGAIQIPGTPTGFDPTSIMLSCFSNSTDGEFNNNDIIALNFLY